MKSLINLIRLAAHGAPQISLKGHSTMEVAFIIDGKQYTAAELSIEQKRELARAMFPGLDPRYLTAWEALRKEEAGK